MSIWYNFTLINSVTSRWIQWLPSRQLQFVIWLEFLVSNGREMLSAFVFTFWLKIIVMYYCGHVSPVTGHLSWARDRAVWAREASLSARGSAWEGTWSGHSLQKASACKCQQPTSDPCWQWHFHFHSSDQSGESKRIAAASASWEGHVAGKRNPTAPGPEDRWLKVETFLWIFLRATFSDMFYPTCCSPQESDSEDNGPTSDTSLNMMNFLRAAVKGLQPDHVERVGRTFSENGLSLGEFCAGMATGTIAAGLSRVLEEELGV